MPWSLPATRSFIADAVIVTVPLGVLKANKILFDPPLPRWKQAAIERIGYGGDAVLNKIFLRFEQRFWQADVSRMIGLPTAMQDRGAFNSWTSLEAFNDTPTLLSFSNGLIAARLDREASDNEIVELALSRLRFMLGREIPTPVTTAVTRWLSDPWALGSYSYPAVGSTEADRASYQEPVGTRLYFAGEGVDPDQYGTIHAALLSGQESAERIAANLVGAGLDLRDVPWQGWDCA